MALFYSLFFFLFNCPLFCPFNLRVIVRNLIKGNAMPINAVIEKDENGYFAFVPYSKRLCVVREKL